MRLIDADAATELCKKPSMLDLTDVPEFLEECPTVEDARVIKHGAWETVKSGDGIFDYHFRCSVCKGNTPDKAYVVAPDWCPSCGAIMDGKRETD